MNPNSYFPADESSCKGISVAWVGMWRKFLGAIWRNSFPLGPRNPMLAPRVLYTRYGKCFIR